MLATNLIRIKRDGGALRDDQWQFLIEGFCAGRVDDMQMAALAMAVCIRGMTAEETAGLTRFMLLSGERLPRVTDRPRVDKHSTGGLGDKVSLILAPLLACCDVDVPMISGRGLGRTGGTLDKLESIDGVQVQLSPQHAARTLRDVGAFILGADERVAPADRRLYAIRDVTATVESIGLITASILSKKLSASLDALIMDVKVGSGAFMTNLADATELAHSLVSVGCAESLPTRAFLSDMDQPLGRAIGNAVEVNESVEVLQGAGPRRVRDLTLRLAASALVQGGVCDDEAAAAALLQRKLDDGSAMERFCRMVAAQGGRWRNPLPLAPRRDVTANHSGWVASIDCPAIGDAIVSMGGGRRRAGDRIDCSVGITLHVEVGDRVERGQTLLSIHGDPPAGSGMAKAVSLADAPIPPRPLVLGEVS